jgi:hypothetical protein
MGKYLGTVPRQLSDEDKDFIKRIEAGERKAPAFRASYPQHPAVLQWHRAEPGSPDRQKAVELVINAAKNKLQTKYMNKAIVTYTDKMEQFSDLAMDTAIDLVQNARSEKVRADLATEGIRHKVGSPTVKIAAQQEKVVYLTFGEPPKLDQIIEGEVVDDSF